MVATGLTGGVAALGEGAMAAAAEGGADATAGVGAAAGGGVSSNCNGATPVAVATGGGAGLAAGRAAHHRATPALRMARTTIRARMDMRRF